ncbi:MULTISPECIES: hypothetical protein [Streptomyces]|uniref:hypothetical protein n=1 Tax=Streptomyces TaxID=1883 RepID=UPI002E271D14|nr:hypothetical protein OH837_21780 [Streptomyces canus]WSZ32622.1 hypothetical protein OG806_25860 [Streptomyces sp. NBC_00882]WSZ59571.1 hypothetical protein OH824_24940 [Streptomyces canus]
MTVPERWKDGLESDTPPAPYATDGTDFGGAVRYHYGVALKKFLKFFPVFLLLWVQLFVFHIDYLLPVAIVGMLGMLWTLFLLAGRLSLTRKCSKVFRTYPLAFRTPVEKIGMESTHTLYLRFGDQDGTPFTLCAKDALGRGRWPVGITDGVWFAGDEPFGGAMIVPGSGELLFLQPRDWAARDEDRANAGPERTEKAGRAGIKRPARR